MMLNKEKKIFKYLLLASLSFIIIEYFQHHSKNANSNNMQSKVSKMNISKAINKYGESRTDNLTFNTSQKILNPKITHKYNIFKSPLSVQPFRDLPYIDDFTTQIQRPKHFPNVYTEKNYTSETQLKKILFWNNAFHTPNFYFGFGQEPFIQAQCPVNTCYTFSDRKKFPYTDWDAVIWHFRGTDKSLPKQRSNHTRYVFWMMECPLRLFGNLKPYNGIFNWTMTYRMDSDISLPYGRVFKKRTITPQGPYVDHASNKTKMAAWFVSNCHSASSREKLTMSIQKYIQVDVYGKCGKFKCEKKQHHSSCLQMLERDYKFYFSFENSLCRDYVTEKFFSILSYNVIPVVYGFGNYSIKAPPHSYIDVLDYPNVRALADYLKYLDKNHTAYNEYFEWKRYYINTPGTPRSWCKLCEMLHTDASPKEYTNLYKWFVTDSHCKDPSSQPIFDFINGLG